MAPKKPAKARGRPINEARADEIVAVAAELFMQQGFHATTMEQIAKTLGISKLTLYSRFKNKDALFEAVIAHKCQQYIPEALFSDFDKKMPEDSLYAIAYALLQLLVSDDASNMEHLLMAEAGKHKQLTGIFYKTGPIRVKTMIAEHLKSLDAKGILRIPDPMLAAHMFTALLKGSDIYLRICMNIAPIPTDKDIRDYCRKAVAMFMCAYRP